MFFNKISNRAKMKKQKNRREPSVYSKRDHQSRRLLVLKKEGGNLELFTYKKIIRKFRKWSKKKKYRIEFRFTPNHIFSNKVKNSRMGKGKGKYTRLVVRLASYSTFMVLTGISPLRLTKYFSKMSVFFRGRFIIKPPTMLPGRLYQKVVA
jgi:hypothetical protein